VSLRGVGQEAGVHVLQVRSAGADGGDAESVATVPASSSSSPSPTSTSSTPASLVRPVVRVVEGLGVRARSAAAAGLRQLAAGGERRKNGLFT